MTVLDFQRPGSYACNVMCRIAGPYPFLGANILKLFADAQVFVVALVGLVLRMDEDLYDRE
eukprot:COSAG06_NODE_44062_length_366_cov_1.067416_1_plen_60_part_01